MKRIVIVLALLSIFALGNGASTIFRLTPRPTQGGSAIALPSSTSGQMLYASWDSTGDTAARAVEEFYFNPIGFTWTNLAGADKYKFKAVGADGVVLKETVNEIACDNTCEITLKLPKIAQKYEWSIKAKDAAGEVIAKSDKLEFKTKAPVKPSLLTPKDGKVVDSSLQVELIFAPSTGTSKYQGIVINPAGATIKSPKVKVDDLCNATECGFLLEGSPSLLSGGYSWRVIALGDFGKTSSTEWSFSVP